MEGGPKKERKESKNRSNALYDEIADDFEPDRTLLLDVPVRLAAWRRSKNAGG